ncbi:nickel-dependent lactate racemase [Saccharothrix sp. NRRL B-16314]|uniref:nickel-dependent lactate racemase n=1 Tax=Saccharothrix sp. NRRL B-16314 TaxID=1463825 RepID=UPI000525A791|nr:nickel-dependent lactate racemase [Saccharothrix sp. NRRL B-16314]
MKVRLAYGDTGLDIHLDPAATTVVEPVHHDAAADQVDVLRAALRSPVAGPPLRDRVRPGQTVAISACDGTRPQPRQLMIPAVLAELDGIVRLEDVVVLVATGTHRGNDEDELRRMFGDEVVDSVRIVNHDARDRDRLTWVGTHGNGVPVWLNREWVDADVRITTGFVEPHFFAGFSGGPKMVAPGLAALETVLVLHDAARIGDPRATWGITRGNPVHDDVRAIAAATGTTFSLDVVLNRDKEVVAAFGGDLLPMHAAATAVAKRMAMRPVDAPFDVVVTTNSGFPLDQNLYQAVKGMSAAHQVVRPGGTIVCAAECRDGFPDHGSYRRVLASAPSPKALFEDISARVDTVPDQWQVQIQARIQSTCRVVMHTSFLSDADLAAAHLEQTDDISATVARALADAGPGARVCVLPEGPQTIPYLAGGAR